jgi:nitroreductase
MEIIDLLTSRASIGADFMTDPGPDEAAMRKILSAGLRVPDHGRLFPWRIQVLRKEAQARLAEFYAKRYRALHPDAREALVEHERTRPQRAPVLLVVSNRLQPGHKIPLLEQTLSGGALCMNMLNAAHGLGYVAQWVTGWPAYDPEVQRALGVPEGSQIIGFIHIGSPGGPPKDRIRASLDEVVSEWHGPAGAAGPA